MPNFMDFAHLEFVCSVFAGYIGFKTGGLTRSTDSKESVIGIVLCMIAMVFFDIEPLTGLGLIICCATSFEFGVLAHFVNSPYAKPE